MDYIVASRFPGRMQESNLLPLRAGIVMPALSQVCHFPCCTGCQLLFLDFTWYVIYKFASTASLLPTRIIFLHPDFL